MTASPNKTIRATIIKATTAGFDRGWVFAVSVAPQDAAKSENLLQKICEGHHINLQKLPVTDIQVLFRPSRGTGTIFLLRQTPQTDVDIGMLSGEVEDALRDNQARPGTLPINMAVIPGTRYTAYRNDTDPEGQLLTPADWADLATARPKNQLYNPFVKPDPWADIMYEYAPSTAQLEPAPKKTPAGNLVEDFDVDLGTLLAHVFSRTPEKYLLQPESAQGWIFDKSDAHNPYYAFYACPETIKPVRQTLRQAGIPFHHIEHSGWQGVVIAKGHFNTAQNILAHPGVVDDLHRVYLNLAQTQAQNLPHCFEDGTKAASAPTSVSDL